MNKKNIIITIISVLLLTCIFAFARTTTTNLGLVKPTFEEVVEHDILVDLNANSDLIDAIFDDVSLTEFGYLDGVTSAIQTQLSVKQPLDTGLTSISGLTTAASTIIYTTALDTYAVLSANSSATNKFLRQVSSGAPSWETLASGDIPDMSATYQPLDTALTNISALTYVSPSYIKLTANDTYAVRTIAQVITDLALDSDDLSDRATIAMLDEAESITGNWVNTTNAWADNEVSDTLTVTGYMQDEDINTFSELDTWVTDKTLVNTANKLSDFAATTSAELAGVISDETGTGKLVYNIAPVLYQNVTTSATTNTLTVEEAGLILVSNTHTETLPTASGNTGLTYHFIKTDYDYDLITLEGDGTETFNYENSTGTPNLTYLRLNTPCAEVTIVSDGTNWQVIDEALGQVPKCFVYLNADQLNLVNNVGNLIEFDTEALDIGSNFNTSTHLFTVPLSGDYHIMFNCYTVSASTVADKGYYLSIYINAAGVSYYRLQASLVYYLGGTMAENINLSKNDTVGLHFAPIDVGGNTVDIDGDGASRTHAKIRLISKD